MRVIGLTGSIASGKTTIANTLRALGATVVDADAISHDLTRPDGPALPPIWQAFGAQVFTETGTLNRAALGRIVFQDQERRAALEAILHPMIHAACRRQLRQSDKPFAFLDAPLLYEAGFDRLTDEVWCAYLPQREQIKRLRARDGLTYREALARIHSQMPAREKARRASLVIRTDGTMAETAALVRQAYQSLVQRSSPAE